MKEGILTMKLIREFVLKNYNIRRNVCEYDEPDITYNHIEFRDIDGYGNLSITLWFLNNPDYNDIENPYDFRIYFSNKDIDISNRYKYCVKIFIDDKEYLIDKKCYYDDEDFMDCNYEDEEDAYGRSTLFTPDFEVINNKKERFITLFKDLNKLYDSEEERSTKLYFNILHRLEGSKYVKGTKKIVFKIYQNGKL